MHSWGIAQSSVHASLLIPPEPRYDIENGRCELFFHKRVAVYQRLIYSDNHQRVGPMLTQLSNQTRYPPSSNLSSSPYKYASSPPTQTPLPLSPHDFSITKTFFAVRTKPLKFPTPFSMDSCSTVSSPFDCLMFADLDDTLYSSKTGIGKALKQNVQDFLVEKCGFSESEAPDVNRELFRTYGSSLAGLRALGYDINPDDYHGFVHGRLPYDLIKPDSRLRNILQSIKQRKIIFTNSDRIHAMKALDRLGIRDCFEKIICFETMNPNLSKSTRPDEFPVVLKPSMEAMRIAIDVAEIDPRRTLFLDDNVKNVAAGKAVGLRTVLVGSAIKSKEADYAMETVTNMVQAIPEIWVFSEEKGDERISQNRADQMDSALATTTVGA
ncbi:UNVERIFIED_CONTAM: hypothetical protein Sindi_1585600 [Sesamum indicum]